jgi:hypothetical protein
MVLSRCSGLIARAVKRSSRQQPWNLGRISQNIVATAVCFVREFPARRRRVVGVSGSRRRPLPARGLVRKKVVVVNYADGRFAVQFNGMPLSFRVFDKILTVDPGTIVENSGWARRWRW